MPGCTASRRRALRRLAVLLALSPGSVFAFGDKAGVPPLPGPESGARAGVAAAPADSRPAPSNPPSLPPACGTDPDPGPGHVRLLAVYDDSALALLGGDDAVRRSVAAMIRFTNEALERSGAMVSLEFTLNASGIRHIQDYVPGVTGGAVSPDEGPTIAALCDLTCGLNGGEKVHLWREETAADLVVFVHAPPVPPPECGMAWVLGESGAGAGISLLHDAPYGYGVISLNPSYQKRDHSVADCPPVEMVFAHEVGHMFGAGHERSSEPQDKIKGAFDSSRAFESHVAKTIMATIGAMGSWRAMYSTDAHHCDAGSPVLICGTDGSSENTETIRATRHCVSSFWNQDTTSELLLRILEDDDRFGRLDRCQRRVARCR